MLVAKVDQDQVEGRLVKKCKELKVLDPKAGQNLCKYQLNITRWLSPFFEGRV